MLKGTLIYRDYRNSYPDNVVNHENWSTSDIEVVEEVSYNVEGVEFPDALWLNISAEKEDLTEFYKANDIMFRSIKSFDNDYTELELGVCRLDISSGIKTNAVNTIFAGRIGSIIKYALDVPSRVINDNKGHMTAEKRIDNTYIKVEYNCSIPVSITIKSKYVDLELVQDDSNTSVYKALKEKDNYGNILSATPVVHFAVKKSEEYLGFKEVKIEESSIPSWGMYQTIEDVIRANSNKNTDWILDRHYEIATRETVDSILDKFMNTDNIIAFDTETTGLDITFLSRKGIGDDIVGFSLSSKVGEGYYFPLRHKLFDNVTDDVDYFMTTKVKPILEGKNIICHNTSFDWKVAYLYGINTNVVFDTLAAFSCTFRYKYGKGYDTRLKALAKTILGLDMFDLEDFVIGEWGADSEINFSCLPYELVRRYATADADMTLALYYWLIENNILAQFNAQRVCDLETQFQKVVAYSEYWGYLLDIKSLPKMMSDIEKGINEHKANLISIVGHDFNPNSPAQLKKVMYEELNIEKIGGQDSTKAEILKELAKMTDSSDKPRYPFANELLAYRSLEGTYTKLIKNRDEYMSEDGYIFPHIFAFGTDTGRVSIKDPNYQSYDKIVKHYIIPRNGYLHFDCDYSQIEYRVLASMAQQENLCDALADPDMDYHTYQAARMFNVPYASVTSSLRKQSKGINFGLPYGMGDRSLGIRIFGKATSENTAKAAQLRKKYFQGQEKIQSFFDVVRSQGVANGYTETWLGRRRYYDKRRFTEPEIRRQAGNHVIQGCLDGDTRIQTKEFGIVKIKDVVGNSLNVWDGKKWTYGDIMYSGKKRKCIVRFRGGQSIICSPTHKFLVVDTHGREHWVECQDLKFGYKSSANNSHVRINENYEPSDYKYSSKFAYKYSASTNNNHNVFLENIGNSYDIGVFIGRLASDGSYQPREYGGSYATQFVSEHEYNILPKLRSCMKALGYTERNIGVREGRNEGMTHLTVHSLALANEVSALDIKHQIHDNIFMDTEVLRGFLSGFFDGDGGISGKTITLTFGTQYDFEPMCLDIQKALLFFGIRSRYRKYDYCHKVVIKTNDNERFLDLIGFLNEDKQNRGRTLTCVEKEAIFGRCIIVDSVEMTDELIDMYDVCNTDDGYYVADGIVTHNTAADIYKMGVTALFDMICREGWLGKVLINAFVHDEILIEIHKSINPYTFLAKWREEYEVKIKGFCKLYAGCGFGKNWYVAKSQDLPPQFIQECIDRSSSMNWDGNIDKFLEQCNNEYFDYKVRRVEDYITDESNEGQIVKPLINSLLIEVTAEKLGVSEKDFVKEYASLGDRIAKFKEAYNISKKSYNILAPTDVKSESSKSINNDVVIAPIDNTKRLIESCLNFGMAVDTEQMILYLRFEPNHVSLTNFIKSLCVEGTENNGYKLRFVVKQNNNISIMATKYSIKCEDTFVLQDAYRQYS